MIATNHAEVLAFGAWMLPVTILAGLVGLAILAGAFGLSAGWVSWLIAVFGAFVAAVGIGSLIFTLWGRTTGYGWHFTR